ncbi:MAG: hypothetical protein ACI8V2_004198 [Candidatus Latescibacterota bacterium]|jgi:hypothetical protein
MKLRTVLSQYPTIELKKLAQTLGFELDPQVNKTVLIDHLCQQLPVPERISDTLDTLSKTQKKLIQDIASEGGELFEEDAIEELANGFEHRLRAQIDELTTFGLVFRDQEMPDHPLIGIPDALLKSIPISAKNQGKLRLVLKSVSVGILRNIAQDLQLSISDTRRPILIRAIHHALLTPDTLKTYLQTQSEEKRAVLDFLLVRQTATRQEITEHLGESAKKELEDLLWKTPFCYSPTDDLNDKDAPLALASDLYRVLQKIAKKQGGQLESQVDDLLAGPTAPPQTTQDNTRHLFPDLATILGLIDRKLPRRLKHGGIPKSDLRDSARFCQGETDPGYVEFLMLFVETAGLVKPRGDIWRTTPECGKRLSDIIEIRQALFAFWQQTDRWNEWSTDRNASKSNKMADLISVRQAVGQALIQIEPGEWITYPSFYHFLTRVSETFRHISETPSSGRNLAAGGTTADELLRRMLSGALAWMGILRTGSPAAFAQPLHRSDQAVFQLTPTGLALLKHENTESLKENVPPQNPNSRIVIQPNFEVLAPPDLMPSVYIELCGLSDLQNQDVMTTFVITREAIQQALNRGETGETIRTFFSTNSATGLPDIVDALITECEGKFGEIELFPAIGFLKVEKPTLLDELYAQKNIAQALAQRLSPTIAALDQSSRPEALLQILHRQGYMPSLLESQSPNHENRHQIVFSTTELSDIVAFLETAREAIEAKTSEHLETVHHLIRRFKRTLRQSPDAPREEAASRYSTLFQTMLHPPQNREDGLEELLRFTGPNPSTVPAEMKAIIAYAIDHQLCVEIAYGNDANAPKRIIEPFSDDHAMLYAFCRERKGDRVFRTDRIHFARLTGEYFKRAGTT